MLTVTDASPLAIQVSGDNLDADNGDNIFSKQDPVVENSFVPYQPAFFADQLNVPSGISISPDDNDELGRLLFACLAAPEKSSQLQHLNYMQNQDDIFPNGSSMCTMMQKEGTRILSKPEDISILFDG